jgi:MerR family transcriptional regulator, mercuric resistance operon regulatory protein
MPTITLSPAENLPIGELSKRSGVNIETIRYYERIKMLPAPPRTASGRRIYGETDLRVLAFIRRARDERLPAKTIARCSGNRVPDCPVLDILDVKRPK